MTNIRKKEIPLKNHNPLETINKTENTSNGKIKMNDLSQKLTINEIQNLVKGENTMKFNKEELTAIEKFTFESLSTI